MGKKKTLKKKNIGSKEILSKYHRVRESLLITRKTFEIKCNSQLHVLDKLRDSPMNDNDGKRLDRAMSRIILFKSDIFSCWNKRFQDDLLEKE